MACSAAGCASLPPGSGRDPRDHFERFNRAMFKFNTAIDHAFMRPVARGYVEIVPTPVRAGISNFLNKVHEGEKNYIPNLPPLGPDAQE